MNYKKTNVNCNGHWVDNITNILKKGVPTDTWKKKVLVVLQNSILIGPQEDKT